MQTDNKSISLTSWLTLLVLSLIWGSSFILIKKSLVAMTPVQMASMRLSVSFIAFLPIVIYLRKKVRLDLWKNYIAIGLFGSGIPAFCYAIGQSHISSNIAGILNSLTPLFALLVGVLVFGVHLTKSKVLGIILGLAGATFLIYFKPITQNQNTSFIYALLIIIATLCYGINANLIKFKFENVSPLVISSMSFAMIGFPFIVYLLVTNSVQEIWIKPDGPFSIYMVILLALMSTVLASVLYFKLVKDTNPLFASSVTYLMPIVSTLWGLMDGEVLNFAQFVAVPLILVGVLLSKK